MQKVEDLRLLPVWVDPQHMVSTAKHIMAGHKLKALGVVANGKLLGAVTLGRLQAAADDDRVAEYLEVSVPTIQSTSDVRDVADLFVQENLEFALSVQGDRFIGVITPNVLLKELQRSFDPLTGLPWSDQLRNWGTEQLQARSEITILFLDIDDFGLYNKKYGHIVGDRVLKSVAQSLLDATDPVTDIVVRYGGDEFAIGTRRSRNETEALAASLQDRLEQAFIALSDMPVTFCIGVQGGKRTHERENVHYAATLDNLINLASRDCLAKKVQKAQEKASAPPSVAVALAPEITFKTAEFVADAPPAARVVGVYADEHSPSSLTTVILSTGSAVVSGVFQRQGKTVLESVAQATIKALERVDPSRTFALDEVLLSDGGGDGKVITVTGHVRSDGEERVVAGVSQVREDLYAAAAEALIQAFSA